MNVTLTNVTYDPTIAITPLVKETLERYPEGFHLIELSVLNDQLNRWKRHLPMVEPFYAVKCNPDPYILKRLLALGVSFDCASETEIDTVLRLGASPDRIIFANPIKKTSDLEIAQKSHIRWMTFDSPEELEKIASVYTEPDEAQLIVRICVDDSSSACRFGSKYGCSLEDVPNLFTVIQKRRMSLIGVSFHVGSGCTDPYAYQRALEDVNKVIVLTKGMGLSIQVIDIGGGFPGGRGEEAVLFEKMATVIRSNIPAGLRIIAEPGRFFATQCQTTVVPVIGIREGPTVNRYYLSEGLYHSFNCIFYDHRCLRFMVSSQNKQMKKAYLFGPTCDALDCIGTNIELPTLTIGDNLIFPDMGAYTIAAGSQFNGYPFLRRVYR